MNKKNWCHFLVIAVATLFPFAPWLVSPACSQTPFYQGKTITIIQGRGPGGAGDMRARAVAQFLPKYLPGNPAIIFEYMPGGGGMKAANHLYTSARPDGLTIASVSSGLMSNAILGNKAAKYQVDKFHYLGAADAGGHYIFYTRKDLGVSNLDKLRAASGIRIGAQAVGHSSQVPPAKPEAWRLLAPQRGHFANGKIKILRTSIL